MALEVTPLFASPYWDDYEYDLNPSRLMLEHGVYEQTVLTFFFFCRVPQVPLNLWVRSRGGLWSSGDTQGTFPGFLVGYGCWGTMMLLLVATAASCRTTSTTVSQSGLCQESVRILSRWFGNLIIVYISPRADVG